MMESEQFLEHSQSEAKMLAHEIMLKTGFKIDFDDPSIITLIAQRRWLSDFYDEKTEQAQHIKAGFLHDFQAALTEMTSVLNEMKNTEKAIEEKLLYLKQENDILKSFREEIVPYFTSKAHDEVQPFVAQIVKEELSGSLNTIHHTLSGSLNMIKLKNQLISFFVLILQIVILLIFVMKTIQAA